MYEVLGKDTIKSKILPHLSLAKRGYVSKVAWRKSFNTFFTSWKLAVDGRLLLRLYDAVFVGCEQQALQPLALVVVSARAFRAVNYERVCGIIVFFCLVFSREFNIKSGHSVHQSLTLPQKIDSRGGLFWCQKGLVVHAGKMNFYLNWPPPTPVLGPFAAKCNAFWC